MNIYSKLSSQFAYACIPICTQHAIIECYMIRFISCCTEQFAESKLFRNRKHNIRVYYQSTSISNVSGLYCVRVSMSKVSRGVYSQQQNPPPSTNLQRCNNNDAASPVEPARVCRGEHVCLTAVSTNPTFQAARRITD